MDLLRVEPAGPREFRLVGEVDVSNSEDLYRILEGATASDGDITLDCERLTFMASAGLQVLVRLARNLAGRGDVILRSTPAHLREVLRLTGVDRLANLEVRGDPPP